MMYTPDEQPPENKRLKSIFSDFRIVLNRGWWDLFKSLRLGACFLNPLRLSLVFFNLLRICLSFLAQSIVNLIAALSRRCLFRSVCIRSDLRYSKMHTLFCFRIFILYGFNSFDCDMQNR